jgi:hypothetical protein
MNDTRGEHDMEKDAEDELAEAISEGVADAIDEETWWEENFPGSVVKTATWIDESLPHGQQRRWESCRCWPCRGESPHFPKYNEWLNRRLGAEREAAR